MRVNWLDQNRIGTRRIFLRHAVIGTPHDNFGLRLDGMDSVSNARIALMVVGAQRVIQNDNINSGLREMGQPLIHTGSRQCFIPKRIQNGHQGWQEGWVAIDAENGSFTGNSGANLLSDSS